MGLSTLSQLPELDGLMGAQALLPGLEGEVADAVAAHVAALEAAQQAEQGVADALQAPLLDDAMAAAEAALPPNAEPATDELPADAPDVGADPFSPSP